MRQTPTPQTVTLSSAAFVRIARRTLDWLMSACLLLAAVALPAQAADAPITWGAFAPTSASILVGDTVTWNGNLGVHPVRVTNASFTTIGPIVSVGGTSYTQAFPSPGTYYFMCAVHGSAMPTTVTVSCPAPPVTTAVLDIDANGVVDANTDGLLVLRYLLGLRGSALTDNVLGTCPNRDATAIQTYLSTKVVP